MTQDLLLDFAQHVQQCHRKHGYETSVRRFAKALGYDVKIGDFANSLHTRRGNVPLITLNGFEYGTRHGRFSGMHEIAHGLLYESGIEAELIRRLGGIRAATTESERFCNQAAGLLLLPHHLLREAIIEHGHGAAAVSYLQRRGRVSMATAIRRFARNDMDTSIAVFYSVARMVHDLARNNCLLPFRRADQLPEDFPEVTAERTEVWFRVPDADVSFLHIKRGCSVGVVLGAS